MTVLSSLVLALLLAAFTALTLATLVLLLVVLLLLILLAADLLLERNGVDRRSAVQRAWRTVRPESDAPLPMETRPEDAAPARRTPFSARHPAAAASTRATSTEAVSVEADVPGQAPEETATEVLPVTRPSSARSARVVRAAQTAAPQSPAVTAPAASTGSATRPTATPAARDSAIDRLFAPLMESESTEPLPTPRAARAKRPTQPPASETE